MSHNERFPVVATDEGGAGHRETAHLHIVVLDANDQPPVFPKELYVAFLPENSLSFTQVLIDHH